MEVHTVCICAHERKKKNSAKQSIIFTHSSLLLLLLLWNIALAFRFRMQNITKFERKENKIHIRPEKEFAFAQLGAAEDKVIYVAKKL